MKKLGDVLKEYRIKKGLSQGELANLLGISPSYLSLIEQGKRRFRFNMIMEIKERNRRIYDELFTLIKKELFSKKLTGVSSWEIDEIIKILEKDSGLKVLRSNLSPSFRTRYNRAISIKGKVYPEMERFIAFTEFYSELEEVYYERIHPPYLTVPTHIINLYETDKRKATEFMATFVRKMLNLGESPISNLEAILEANGIKVFSFPIEKNRFSGCVIHSTDIGPAILYNWNDTPARKPFTLAHELGHLVLSTGEDMTVDRKISDGSTEHKEIQESMVNDFASAFLMPETTYRYYWYNIVGTIPTRMHINILKDIFNVSYSAALYRAVQIDLINFDTYHHLKLKRTGRFYRQGDFNLKEALPQRFVYLLLRALADGKYTKEEVKKRLRLTKRELERIISSE
ncbi:hypothetical protein DRQ17_03210 [bacterium]|nr:MAG: hypothetical protein DRQ17_03210 [bacterium]